MRIVQRYGYNGYHMHQTVEGVGEDLEIQQYGEGIQGDKRGVFGVVHPSIDNEKKGVTSNVLVINIDGKWIPTKEDEEKCQVCGNTFVLSALMTLGTGQVVCSDCGQDELKKRRGGR